MRIIALDVHRSFVQTAVRGNGTLRDTGKVDFDHNRLLHFAKTLKPDDEVVLEATRHDSDIVRMPSPFVARVVKDRCAATGEALRERVSTRSLDVR